MSWPASENNVGEQQIDSVLTNSTTARGSNDIENNEPLSDAQEPGLDDLYNFDLFSSGVDEFFCQCGAVPEAKYNDSIIDEIFINSMQESPLANDDDSIEIPQGLNAAEVILDEVVDKIDVESWSTSYFGINSIVRNGASLKKYYEKINAITCDSIREKAHIDGGAQTNVTGNKDLIWYMKTVKQGPKLRVADGTIHRPSHEGYLCLPCPTAPNGTNKLFVHIWYIEGFPSTIISPNRIGRQYQCGTANLTWPIDGSDCTVRLAHKRTKQRDIYIPAVQLEGLL
jgi:hypothetical protein